MKITKHNGYVDIQHEDQHIMVMIKDLPELIRKLELARPINNTMVVEDSDKWQYKLEKMYDDIEPLDSGDDVVDVIAYRCSEIYRQQGAGEKDKFSASGTVQSWSDKCWRCSATKESKGLFCLDCSTLMKLEGKRTLPTVQGRDSKGINHN